VIAINNSKRKILGNTENLVLNITTNNLIDPTDFYLLTIRNKEKIIYSEALKLKKNSNLLKTI